MIWTDPTRFLQITLINNTNSATNRTLSRRKFLHDGLLTASALTALPILGCRNLSPSTAAPQGPAAQIIPMDSDWLFGGELKAEALSPEFDDSAFAKITLPHCPTKLSWQDWSWEDWQKVWCYRRHFVLPDIVKRCRVFLEFDGVMVGAEPVINGHTLPKHLGGYLPFQYEITEWVKSGSNVLAVALDSRWSDVPPQGSRDGPKRVDYLEAGGIHRPVRLLVMPQIFVGDVFAKPVHVLDPNRRLDVLCTLDAAATTTQPVKIVVELKDGDHVLAREQLSVVLEKAGQTEVSLQLKQLENIKLWDVDNPHLYDVVTTLSIADRPVHDHRVRIGFREARFETNGFQLNGRRLQIFGLNRHEIYPYTGFAMPPRVKRRDAEILKHDFNVNFVRCSHYPQSPAFLDACDELGLLVWQEVPGWGYIGDDPWKELLVRDAREMIIRDRNRPSIVIWGTRANETDNDVELYRRTKAIAKSLDDSRPTSGSMTTGSRGNWQKDWHEDVFAFDDYHSAPDHTVGIDPPVQGIPYMLAEAVGQFNYTAGRNFNSYYRRATDPATQQLQALRHAQAHDKAAADPRICGVVAWCAFEYASPVNDFKHVKYPGVADVFRIPKLGASFYMAQCDPKIRLVIEPNFYWDFGPATPRGPGKKAIIFSNCDQLGIFISGRHHATVLPDKKNFPHLKHAPFFVDLDFNGAGHPELRIDGFVGGRLALSRSFSSDPAYDRFQLTADHHELAAGGVDATRLVFKVVDNFGANRAFAGGSVSFSIAGPGTLVGDNPFDLKASGGAGAVWVRTLPDQPGRISITARHSELGTKSVEIHAQA
jgi:beta-galactosidase